MPQPLQILIVSPIPTHPSHHGNRVRLTGVIKAIKALGHRVVLIYGAREPIDHAAEADMASLVDHMMVIDPIEPVCHTPRPGGFALDDWWMPEVMEAVDQILQTVRIDVALATYVWFSKWLDAIPASILKVLDTHDIFANRYDRLARAGVDPQFFSTSQREENRGLARGDWVLAIQDHEYRQFLDRGVERVAVLGHLTERQETPGDARSVPDRSQDQVRVGFFASDNGLNQQAVRHLSMAIETHALSRRVDWVLAGSIAAQPVADQWPGTRIPWVDHPSDFYQSVDVVVNPHMGGTGLKIKSVEALSYGKALIGTQDAMIGLPSPHPLHDLTTVQAVVQAVSDIADNPKALSDLKQAGSAVFDSYQAKQRQTLETILSKAGAR